MTEPVTSTDVAPTNGDGALRRARRGLLVGAAVVGVGVPALLAAARYPRWWEWIASEQTPMTWVQSVVLVVAAAAALLVQLLLRTQGDVAHRTFLLLAAGLVVLGLDERFAVHERIRDGFLAPRDVRIPFLPWVAAGDFLMLAVAAVGLAFLPRVWRAVRADVLAGRLLLAGVGLAAVAVGVDSIDPANWSIDGERWQQTREEIVELAAVLCLFCAVTLRLLDLVSIPTRSTRSMSSCSPVSPVPAAVDTRHPPSRPNRRRTTQR